MSLTRPPQRSEALHTHSFGRTTVQCSPVFFGRSGSILHYPLRSFFCNTAVQRTMAEEPVKDVEMKDATVRLSSGGDRAYLPVKQQQS